MNIAEAKKLAEAHISEDMVLLDDQSRECEFGFYFATDSRKHQNTGRFENLLIGSWGVLVDRETGEVHDLSSAFDLEYWFEAYRRHLHVPNTVVVKKVKDQKRAVDALYRLQMTYVIPEQAHGEIWKIPKQYSPKSIKDAINDLPVCFENQDLIFRLREIETIEAGHDLEIILEPMMKAE
jgi:hypothetical protein